MKEKFSVGDIVKSIAGRDKDVKFLVIEVENERVLVVDGKTRKIKSPKKKNKKHLSLVLSVAEKELAEKIQSGKPTGNEKVYRAIKSQLENKQED